MGNKASKDESVPEVVLSDAQAERAYQLKAQWERPNSTLLIPITLTRYIVYLRDEFAYWKDQALRGAGETPDELAKVDELLQTMIVGAQVYVDAEQTITAYKIKTGALHKLAGLRSALFFPQNLPLAALDQTHG